MILEQSFQVCPAEPAEEELEDFGAELVERFIGRCEYRAACAGLIEEIPEARSFEALLEPGETPHESRRCGRYIQDIVDVVDDAV